MARKRNSERLESPTPEDTSVAAAVAATTHDIFSFVSPTEFVELPSKGRFYEEGSALAGVKEIEIRHMTAKEEDLLTSETLLRKGLALDRMLQSLLVDKSLDLDDFLIGDKNALIIASRITGFGSEYITRVTCPSCATVNEAEFDLEQLSLHLVEDLPSEVEGTVEGTFRFTLPTTEVELEVRLLTTRLEKQLSAATERKKKMNLPDTRSTDLLKAVIASINTVTDTSMINRFVDLMPARDSRYLRKVYERIKPDVDLDHEFTCESCSYGGKVVMPLTAEFFWPRD
jgi:hypothetical protein